MQSCKKIIRTHSLANFGFGLPKVQKYSQSNVFYCCFCQFKRSQNDAVNKIHIKSFLTLFFNVWIIFLRYKSQNTFSVFLSLFFHFEWNLLCKSDISKLKLNWVSSVNLFLSILSKNSYDLELPIIKCNTHLKKNAVFYAKLTSSESVEIVNSIWSKCDPK